MKYALYIICLLLGLILLLLVYISGIGPHPGILSYEALEKLRSDSTVALSPEERTALLDYIRLIAEGKKENVLTALLASTVTIVCSVYGLYREFKIQRAGQ